MINVYKNTVAEAYKVNLTELGLTFLEFNPLSLESDLTLENIQGADGGTITSNQFKERLIQGKLFLRATDNIDFQNKKANVYKLFNSKQKLLIVDERLETKKIWEVTTDGDSYILDNEQTSYTKEFEITFVSESPYAPALEATETIINTTRGFVFNDGDVYLDAREHTIQIHFEGESDKLRIVNETTNTQWQHYGATTVEDEIYIDSVYPYLNNKPIKIDNTDYGAIEFAEGSNEIRVYGATGDFTLIIQHIDLFI